MGFPPKAPSGERATSLLGRRTHSRGNIGSPFRTMQPITRAKAWFGSFTSFLPSRRGRFAQERTFGQCPRLSVRVLNEGVRIHALTPEDVRHLRRADLAGVGLGIGDELGH